MGQPVSVEFTHDCSATSSLIRGALKFGKVTSRVVEVASVTDILFS